MMPKPVETTSGITLVGGGPVTRRDLKLALKLAPVSVAADGGADNMLAAGQRPGVIIGDFDSLSDQARAAVAPEDLYHIPDQSSTDFDKALRSLAAPFVIAIGFSGGRSDHALAVLNSLVRHSLQPCLVLGPKDVSFALPPGRFEISMQPGDLFSLFPFARVCGKSEGLEWPLDPHVFAPDGFIGTSNRVTARRVRLDMAGNGMVAILPRARLRQAIAALSLSPRG